MDEVLANKIDEIMEEWDRNYNYCQDSHTMNTYFALKLGEANYRLDPYPNGKSKDELITRIEVVEAERDKAKNLLRQEHDKVICQNWLSGLPTYRRIHEEREPDCPVCAFLDETSLVKP